MTKTDAPGATRKEKDFIGTVDVPNECYYGVQTLRALDNFKISRSHLFSFPELIVALADVKQAAAEANFALGLLEEEMCEAIVAACLEIKEGKLHKQFVVDMMQGGAGTSTNMNANEVIANRALELMGHEKGAYEFCHPNNHVNLSQSTNDVYPTALKIAIHRRMQTVTESLELLIESFREKAGEFAGIIKMGRTQLQDAVPMTLGQEFEAFAVTLNDELKGLQRDRETLLDVNMGATAIGTGINADPEYSGKCIANLAAITGLPIVAADDLIEATSDTGAFMLYSSALKRLAIKLSKICNDLRLLSSGPRAGIGEINLPPLQPGSSIMPGKVNPVVPEVVNQIAFKVIGNDMAITMACEAGQLQLNVMEPVIASCILESIELLCNGMNTLRGKCIMGITANVTNARRMVLNSIGLVTALNPLIGYEKSAMLAKEALKTGKSIYDLVLEHKILTVQELDDVLKPENMLRPRKIKSD